MKNRKIDIGWKGVIAAVLLFVGVVGYFMYVEMKDDDKTAKAGKEASPEASEEVVDNLEKSETVVSDVLSITVDLLDKSDAEKKTYDLVLLNDSEEEVKLSSQYKEPFTFSIVNSEGEVAYHSAKTEVDKPRVETIPAKETVTHAINIDKAFAKLSEGSYTLTVQSTADELISSGTSITFSKAGKVDKDGIFKDVVTLKGKTATSMEGVDKDGNENFYSLSSEAHEVVSKLEFKTKLEVTYTIFGDFKMVQSVKVLK